MGGRRGWGLLLDFGEMMKGFMALLFYCYDAETEADENSVL
jgi:hypothetical protein